MQLFYSGNCANAIVHITCIIEVEVAPLDPSEKHQYRNKGDVPVKMICGVPKEFE